MSRSSFTAASARLGNDEIARLSPRSLSAFYFLIGGGGWLALSLIAKPVMTKAVLFE
jgi:hypothetical protein